jgi:hypothetical protein
MGDRQWVDGRSAKELARAWVGSGTPVVPAALTALLDSCELTRGFVCDEAFPEHVTRLDDFRGEHRNHDLLVIGSTGGGPTVIGVEGKNDEVFGDIVGEYHAVKSASDVRSNVPARIEQLVSALVADGMLTAAPLRYQLLTASMGTLIEASARGANQAVVVVHTFRSNDSKPDKLAQNAADYAAFVRAFDSSAVVVDGVVAGPYSVPGSDVQLLTGKIGTDVSAFS